MPILGLHFQSGVILSTSSPHDSYVRGVWQIPVQLTDDVFCVCMTHSEGYENLRHFIENIRMECSYEFHTPQTVARVIQRKMMEQGVKRSYIQFLLGGIDRTLSKPSLYNVINGVLLENKTYCIGESEAQCKNMQGYLDLKYTGNMDRKDAINLVRNTFTLKTIEVVTDMVVMEIGKPVKKLAFFKDEATKFNIGGSDV